MQRAILFFSLVAVSIGCGKQKPAAPDSPPPNSPKAGNAKADPKSGQPKDTLKVLSPRAVFKTGYRYGNGDSSKLFLSADGTRLAVGPPNAKKMQVWDVSGEPKK